MREEHVKWPVRLPSLDFAGRTAVVTGSTKGIGYGIAMAFARCGARVVISGRRQEDCDRVAEEIRALGGTAIGVRADVGNVAEVEALLQEAARTYRSVDILVNSAGVAVTKKLFDLTETDYDTVMNTNLKGLLFASREAARIMAAQSGGGRIIQVASIGGLKGSNGLSVYGASKAAVINLTKTMALEWSRYSIQVNAICPGYVVTEINRRTFEQEEFLQRTLKQIPQRRLGTVEEVASLALYLASDLAYMITGEAITADMGSTCG